MTHSSQSPRSIQSLDVVLNGRKIGAILRSLVYALSFEQDYRERGGFPVLSLSFRSATGELRMERKPFAGILSAFFASLTDG